MTKNLLRTLLVGVALLCLAPPAQAKGPLDDLPAVRNKLLLHEGRHVVAPSFAFTVNDPYVRNLLLGAAWRYYLNNWFGIGVDVAGGIGVGTDLADDIEDELSRADRPFGLSTSSLRLLANATAEFVPLDGKFMLFGKHLARIDVHLIAGVGMALVDGEGRIEDEVSLMPMFGIGTRLYPAEWIAIGVDVRDYVINRTLASDRDGAVPGREFGHNWAVGFSVNFFLPDEPDVRP